MFKKEITREEVNQLELYKYDGEIVQIDTFDDLNDILPDITSEKVVGFDTETRPSFRKGRANSVALLQLATSSKVYIIKVKKLGCPAGIRRLFEDDGIVKVGVAIHDDLKELKEFGDFEERSTIDLSHYYKARGFKHFGLRKMAAMILGIRISKSQQTSNWEAEKLTSAQLLYAATDAWACRAMYVKTQGKI